MARHDASYTRVIKGLPFGWTVTRTAWMRYDCTWVLVEQATHPHRKPRTREVSGLTLDEANHRLENPPGSWFRD